MAAGSSLEDPSAFSLNERASDLPCEDRLMFYRFLLVGYLRLNLKCKSPLTLVVVLANAINRMSALIKISCDSGF